MLATGLRFGEAAGLQWADVDLDGRFLTVRHSLAHLTGKGWTLAPPKTKSGRRTVPLAAIALEAVRLQQDVVKDFSEAAGDKWEDNALVFPSERGTPLRESHVLKRFHDLLDTTELPQRRMHDLRHSFATTLFALGTHPRAVQDMLGHARIEITLGTYTASVPEVLREAADNLGRALARAK